jgi:hypothetical protein
MIANHLHDNNLDKIGNTIGQDNHTKLGARLYTRCNATLIKKTLQRQTQRPIRKSNTKKKLGKRQKLQVGLDTTHSMV